MKSFSELKKKSIPWSQIIPIVVLIALYIAMVIANPQSFSLSYLGIKGNIALPLILIGVGQTLVIISKGMDLSVGGIMSISTCIIATLSDKSLILAIALCIVLGMVTGLVNSFLITCFKLQPFVATLGTWTVLDGFALSIMKTDGGVVAQPLVTFMNSNIGPVAMSFILIVIILIIWQFAKNTALVYSIYAVGSNEKAAFCNGVHVTRIKVITYVISGIFASFGGIAYAGLMSTGSPTVGEPNIMMSVAAVVIGGTSLAGGAGGLAGTVIGVFILKVIGDILIFAGVTSYWTSLFQGLLLIVSVVLGSITYILKRGGNNYD